MSKPVTALLQKEMTRKEFMGTLALGLGSIMGFSTIIRLLTGKSLDSHLGHASLGYGSTPYGGGKE
ncbi:MAG TPA: hypothetical protein VK712_03330 [Verrucomicrobiae bacterium]|jgi:hypothetical protein|nr:hypothetical protein [Verrucomicrobiae bacterium]